MQVRIFARTHYPGAFHAFSQFLQENFEAAPQIVPRPLPSTCIAMQFDNYPTIRSCTVWATVLTTSPINTYKSKQTTISHPSPKHSNLILNHRSEFVTIILPLNIVQTRWPIHIPNNITHLSALPITLNAFIPTDFTNVTHIYRSYACI